MVGTGYLLRTSAGAKGQETTTSLPVTCLELFSRTTLSPYDVQDDEGEEGGEGPTGPCARRKGCAHGHQSAAQKAGQGEAAGTDRSIE